MPTRKGLGKNKGKGYKNILNIDPNIHSQSAKGMKQPQQLNIEGLIRQAQVKGKQQQSQGELQQKGRFYDVDEISKPQVKSIERQDISQLGAETKSKAFIKRTKETASKGLEFARKQLKASQERKSIQKIKLLEEIHHPITQKLTKQKDRVAELKKQIAENEDESREDKLFDELRDEENQLREVQEEATGMQLQELNDSELKTLAVRYKPGDVGILNDFFSDDKNPYQVELVRRIKKQQEVETQIAEVRKQAKKKPEPGMFEDFFSQ